MTPSFLLLTMSPRYVKVKPKEKSVKLELLSNRHISTEDDYPTAWITIISNQTKGLAKTY